MILFIIYVAFILCIFIFSKKNLFEFSLKHSRYLKYFYKAYIPISKHFLKYVSTDNRLFLIYPENTANDITLVHISMKLCMFCIMLFLPMVAFAVNASSYLKLISFIICIISVKCVDLDIKSEYELLKEKILSDFSIYLTNLTLYIGSGMTLYQAFVQQDMDLPDGIFKDQIKKLVKSIELRSSAEDAFLNLSIALPITQINAFCSIMISGFKNTEAGLKDTLKAYTSSIWTEKKNRAKIRAEQAGAKAVFALAIGLVGILLILIAPAMLMLNN
jgi:hypothetical protein